MQNKMVNLVQLDSAELSSDIKFRQSTSDDDIL